MPGHGVLRGSEYDRPVITAAHLLIYSDDPEATRSFLRDVLGWAFVEEPDVPGWLIFKTGPSELGVHPTHQTYEGVTYDNPRHHSISLMCDDLAGTMATSGPGAPSSRGTSRSRPTGSP